ncbi:MAG TPA: hypothetical protein VGA69_12790 [Nitriliruptorales bacterium]
MTTPCRCEILNTLTGDIARDYSNAHLEPETATRHRDEGRYRCPDTGVTWVLEHDRINDAPRLRRTDHR